MHNLMQTANQKGLVIPAMNIPYLPMMKPIIQALKDTETFALIEVARLEWEKFEAGSLEQIRDTYETYKDERYTRLHLDHVPVIDEDNKLVDYLEIIGRAIELGYDSVMVDGSRLPLAENIKATKQVTALAHAHNIPVEAELGAVAGHEEGPLPPYEELFASKQGFTDLEEAKQFASETKVDWLSIAFGNIHGAISKAKKNETKISAKLDIDHLKKIHNALAIPLVLHGGSGIPMSYVNDAIINGIAKINIGTEIRQSYEKGLKTSIDFAQNAVYDHVCQITKDSLHIAGKAKQITGNL